MTNHSPELIAARLALDEAEMTLKAIFNVAVEYATKDFDACRQGHNLPNNWMLTAVARERLCKAAEECQRLHDLWTEEAQKS